MTRLHRLAGVSLVALASTFLPLMPVFAQSAQVSGASTAQVSATPRGEADAADTSIAEITVTAQKRETSLQRTPIAIAVLGADDLANRHVLSLTDLGDGAIPSLRVQPFFGRNSALVVNIRGVGALGDSNQPAREQGAGVYLDGVYLGRAQGLGAALYDVERIEVLKGPQGTLFGRNTEGGAVSIVTRKPSGEFHADMTAGVGNFNSREAIAHIDLPAFHDISVKVDALYQHRDGTVDNPLAGEEDFNGYDRYGAHIAALWRATPNFDATYAFDISRDATTPYLVQLLAPGRLPLAPITPVRPDRVSEADVGVPQQESLGHTSGHMLNLDWHVGAHTQIRSITSYRELDQSQYDNGAVAISVYAPNSNFGRYSLANFDQRQFSQELQLIGDISQISYVGGLYYYHEHVEDDAWTPNTLRFNANGTGYTVLPPPGIAATPFPDRASTARTSSAAAFGQATWTPAFLDERLHLTGGLRYSHDKKDGHLDRVNGAVPVLNGVTGEVPFEVKSDRVDPLVNIAADVARGVHVYGKWSTGYKAGGANSRSLTYRTFAPESVSVFEIGAKTEFLDRRVRLNVAAYTGKYKDVQIDFNAVNPGVNRTTLETTNADGDGRIKGVEADLTVVPLRGLTLNASYAYNYVRLPEAPNPFVAGNPLVDVYPIYTPRHAASGAVDYALPLNGPTLFLHLDANYATRQFTSASDLTPSDKSFLVNGRITLGEIALNNGGAELQLSMWARNLFDKEYAFVKNFNASLGTYGIFNQPRTFGFEGRIKF